MFSSVSFCIHEVTSRVFRVCVRHFSPNGDHTFHGNLQFCSKFVIFTKSTFLDIARKKSNATRLRERCKHNVFFREFLCIIICVRCFSHMTHVGFSKIVTYLLFHIFNFDENLLLLQNIKFRLFFGK